MQSWTLSLPLMFRQPQHSTWMPAHWTFKAALNPTAVLGVRQTNCTHPHLILVPNRELIPSLSSFALLSPSVSGLRQGTEPGRATSWNKSICGSRPGLSSHRGASDSMLEPSPPPSRCRWLRFPSASLPHNNTLCSTRAESQLCPVNLNLWHTYSGRTYCCTSYKGMSFQRGREEVLARGF